MAANRARSNTRADHVTSCTRQTSGAMRRRAPDDARQEDHWARGARSPRSDGAHLQKKTARRVMHVMSLVFIDYSTTALSIVLVSCFVGQQFAVLPQRITGVMRSRQCRGGFFLRSRRPKPPSASYWKALFRAPCTYRSIFNPQSRRTKSW